MKILVYPHTLEIGGSQLNAIELAAAVRDLGHEVVIFAQPGALNQRIEELGLPFIAAPRPGRRPSGRVIRALCAEVRNRNIDLVHGYEWTTVLEAYWGPRLRTRTPVVATVMSMAVAPFLPHDLPLVVGTEQIAECERRSGRRDVSVIEPPVDDIANAPGAADAAAFRQQYGIASSDFAVVSVSRLATELKLEGLLSAIDAAGVLAAEDPRVRLVLVGDGPAAHTVRTRAEQVNARCGRPVVVLTGELSDPRPAYAAADVCLGMGGSALRAMAFAKPLIVQGEQGFWSLLTPETAPEFFWAGWYGRGTDARDGCARLVSLVRELQHAPDRCATLADYGRSLVNQRFSLRAAAHVQQSIYRAAAQSRPFAPGPALASAQRFVRHEATRTVAKFTGGAADDDFNAVPISLPRPVTPGVSEPDPRRTADPSHPR